MEERDKVDYIPAEYCRGYSDDVDVIRERQYPLLRGKSPSPSIENTRF